MAILASVTPLVEQLSIDEAFLDVARRAPPARRPAPRSRRMLRRAIRGEAGLVASVGVAIDEVPRQARERPGEARRPARRRRPGPSARSSRRCRSPGSGASAPRRSRTLERMGVRTIGDVAALPRAGARRRARRRRSAGTCTRSRATTTTARGRARARGEVDRRRGDVRAPTCTPRAECERELVRLADRVRRAAARAPGSWRAPSR